MTETIATTEPRRILIVGGGFAGIRTALDLSRKHIPNIKITLVSDKHHFEFTPSLYKLAVGRSPMESCIPLSEIFDHTDVEIIIDTITGGDLSRNVMFGSSGAVYRFDFILLALGSELAYFNIPGIKEHSFNIKTVENALRLKRHLHTLFDTHTGLSKGALMSQFQFVIVGGGPAGIELAGEIRKYVRELAKNHEVPEKLMTVDIIQGGNRLLPVMPEDVSRKVQRHLEKLGINVVLNRPVVSQDHNGVYLKDIEFNAKTIIWTAGVQTNTLYKSITGLSLDPKGRIIVDGSLRAEGYSNVFVAGDSASTKYAGTAQTAIYDGHFISKAMSEALKDKPLSLHKPRRTPYVVPAGPGWAIFTFYNITVTGRIIWWLRQFIDLRFFVSILPLRKALSIWREGETICESCPTCERAENATD